MLRRWIVGGLLEFFLTANFTNYANATQVNFRQITRILLNGELYELYECYAGHFGADYSNSS